METITIWQLILAMSIPSAVTGLFFRSFEKKTEKRREIREEHEKLILESISASLALGEATAEAVARIPDARCNGDMHAALEYAREVKHKQKNFSHEQRAKAVT